MALTQSWTAGLSKELAAEVRKNYLESLVMRRRLALILERKVDDSAREGRSKLLYDNPNWALLQADQRGYERALVEILKIIEK